MNVYRVRNWTHYEPKPARLSFSFKAPSGQHAVVLHLGNVPDGEPLTETWLLQALADAGLLLREEAEITVEDKSMADVFEERQE